MKTRKRSFVCAIVALLLLTPINALACACCSESGYYFSDSIIFSEHLRGEFERMRFAKIASLYLSPAGMGEDSLGIEHPQESYQLNGSLQYNVLRLSFRSGANTGALELRMPAKIWNHSADIHDRKLSAGGGPLLYKEWRFEGDVIGSGIFKAGTSPAAKYKLILQGRGNGCDNAEDFSNWRVEVKGKDAGYAFFGKFAKPGQTR